MHMKHRQLYAFIWPGTAFSVSYHETAQIMWLYAKQNANSGTRKIYNYMHLAISFYNKH